MVWAQATECWGRLPPICPLSAHPGLLHARSSRLHSLSTKGTPSLPVSAWFIDLPSACFCLFPRLPPQFRKKPPSHIRVTLSASNQPPVSADSSSFMSGKSHQNFPQLTAFSGGWDRLTSELYAPAKGTGHSWKLSVCLLIPPSLTSRPGHTQIPSGHIQHIR